MAKWTREKIIREILRREAAGLPLFLGASRERVESKLYQAGSRVFGSWGNAVKAAGIAPERAKARDHWPPSKILAKIRSLSRRQQPPRPGELKRRHGYLMQAARRCFGSWSKAVVAAGVDPEKLKRVMPWTQERVIEAILTRALNCEPLGSRTVKPRSLAEAAARVFGSWQAALAAAGIDPEQASRRQRGAELGLKGSSRTPHDQTVARARVGHLGQDNPGALDTACSAPVQRRSNPGTRWSDEEILQAIRARLRENKRMNAAVVDEEDGPLYRVAKRRYGSWRNALLAAGFNPDEFCARPVTGPVPPSRTPRSHL